MEKKIHAGFIFMLVLMPFLMYLSYLMPQNIVYSPAKEVPLKRLSPLTVEQQEKTVSHYTFDVSDRAPACDALLVQSKHAEVTVTANGELLYSLKRGEMPWMNTVGTVYDLVYLPERANTLDITVHSLYPNVSSSRAIFSIGNGAEIFKSLSGSFFIPSIISITEIFVGILMLVFWYVFWKRGQSHKALFYLAIFSIAVGSWSLSGSVNFIFIVRNQAAASATSFITLMFFVVPFVQFTKHYYGYFKRLADVISLSAIVMTVVLIALHLCGIVGLKQSLTIVHVHIAAIAILHICSFVRFVMSGKQDRRKYINIVSTVILMGSTLIDFFVYFLGNMQMTSAGRFGFIIYFFVLGSETIADMASSLSESKKAEIYKELAYTDNLTKLNNRNAFMSWEKSLISPDGLSVIHIDLNDLKKCNDTFGHANGDKYIIDSAGIIFDIFKDYGTCYRVGGDEFTVVVKPEFSLEQIRKLLQQLEKKEAHYNASSDLIRMHMAYGYAKYDPETDASIESVCIRADSRMYEHKKEMKEKSGGSVR